MRCDLNTDFLKDGCSNHKLLIDFIECFQLRITSQNTYRYHSSTSIPKVYYILINANPSDYDVENFELYKSEYLIRMNNLLDVNTESMLKFVMNTKLTQFEKFHLTQNKLRFS